MTLSLIFFIALWTKAVPHNIIMLFKNDSTHYNNDNLFSYHPIKNHVRAVTASYIDTTMQYIAIS